jgi:uncharacterized membrane-anchored protein YitT (DUF2179 family)
MRPLTIFLSRLIGLFSLVFALAMILHRDSFAAVTSAMIHDPPLVFLLGLIALAIGLAMVLSHNIWSGGALPVVITLIGWLQLIRGITALLVPPEALASFFDKMNFGKFSYGPFVITLALGLYLTYMGFRPSRP